jgi:hypothetical protein
VCPQLHSQRAAAIQHLGDVEDVSLAMLADLLRRNAAPMETRQNRQCRDALLERVIVVRGLWPLRPGRRHVLKLRLCGKIAREGVPRSLGLVG